MKRFPLSKKSKKEIGEYGEGLAIRFLKRNGYRILEKNYRFPMGEIDIIASDKDTLVFIEVKTKKFDPYIPPEISVNRKKQEKIIKGALCYIKDKEKDFDRYRFDVVAINLFDNGKEREIKLFRDAFHLSNQTHYI